MIRRTASRQWRGWQLEAFVDWTSWLVGVVVCTHGTQHLYLRVGPVGVGGWRSVP